MVCSSKTKGLRTQVLILFLLFPLTVFSINFNSNSNGSYLSGIRLPDHAFSTDCNFASSSSSDSDYNTHPLFGHQSQNRSLRLHLRHPSPPHDSSRDDRQPKKCDSILESTLRDLNRIHTFRRRITENKNTNPRRGSSSSSTASTTRHLLEQRKQKESDETVIQNQRQLIMGTLKSGVTLGSGEYLMDVYIGTPPRKFSLIVDTGSDLNWIQCVPCYDCFQQDGSYYDPLLSSSFKNISCHDPRCRLVSSPDPPGRPCGTNSSGSDQSSCPYFYWYGDSSNTTGDFALETFTVNLTGAGGGRGSELRKVEDVMFGCGHWNRGLFHGAAGLLGLGRGPLSFATQLQSLYGHSFSYCLVDRYSDYNITSKLIFGEDKELMNHPQLNFTSLVDSPAGAATAGNNTTNNNTATTTNPAATFYYVQIKSVLIDGQVLGNIPEETWRISDEDGTGGTIIDSGTTLSYFTKPAHDVIRDAFMKRVSQRYHDYPLVRDFPVLDPCYNVSGVRDHVEFPDFGILFEDGGFWNFPAENNFIWINDEVVCLAILGAGKQDFSIIGNYQQQNFHVLYDIQGSKLGFAPRRCSDV